MKCFRHDKPQVDWNSNKLFCKGVDVSIVLLQYNSQVPIISKVQVLDSKADWVVQDGSFHTSINSLVASIVHLKVNECIDTHNVIRAIGKTKKPIKNTIEDKSKDTLEHKERIQRATCL